MPYNSQILALEIVSESEISKIYPDYDSSWETDKPYFFREILYNFGIDVDKPYERQDGLQHRNKLNEVVICSRWVGKSREDEEWLNSGLASAEVKDRVKHNRLLDDCYRARGLTEDVQRRLEERDSRTMVTEEGKV